MFNCHVCGSEKAEIKTVDQTFRVNGELVLVEQIPAQVCCRCGEVLFSSETAEKIRTILHNNIEPTDSIKVKVFAYN